MKETATITRAAALDLLTMTRTFPDAEWAASPAAEVWVFAGEEVHTLHGTACNFVTSSGDLYRALDDAADLLRDVRDVTALAVVTWGWAAPIDTATGEPDGAPSEHPKRRRVRLVAVVDHAGVTSRITFADDSESIDDDGEARGPLADALADAFDRIAN